MLLFSSYFYILFIIIPRQTVETAKILLKYWIEVHYLAVGVKTHYKSDSYIWKVACTLISLMNERAKASLTDNTNIDSFIDSAEDSGLLHDATVSTSLL